MTDAWAQFGINGLIIGTLFALIIFLIKGHQEERKEWLQAYKEVSHMTDQRQAETNAVLIRMADKSGIRSS
jgi:hypothetical protein